MINIKNFHPDLLNISKISLLSINDVIYSNSYITMKSLDHVNFDCENSLYPNFNNVDGYIEEESNGYKYLVFALTGKNTEILEKYKKFGMKLKTELRE